VVDENEGTAKTEDTKGEKSGKGVLGDELKYFLDRRYVYVVAVLLLLAGSGAYVAYTAHATTETVTEERVTATWTTSSEFEHNATVQRDSVVFEEGETLEGRAVYFSSLSPELEGTYTFRQGGSDPGPATASLNLSLVLRSVGGEGVEYWRVTDTLATVEDPSLEAGEPLTAGFSVNVTETVLRIEEIERDLGASPGETQILVTAETDVEGEVGDEEFNETRTESLRVELGSGTYSVGVNVGGQNTERATETFETTVEPSPLSAYGSVVLAFVSSVGLIGVLVGRRLGAFELPPETIERLEFESQRDGLDEWISRGSMSGEKAETVMRLESLEGLVDVAIDSNRRVTELDDGRYVVIVDGVRYVYEPGFDESDVSE
jgi:hypothetical protein